MTTQPTTRITTRATFTIEHDYHASPSRVYAAWIDPVARRYWFGGGDAWKETLREDDIRVGGQSCLSAEWPGGRVTRFDARYDDVVPNERIIFTYDMHLNDAHISVSLATVEFKPRDSGTHLVFTEHLVCLDGYEDVDARSRESGTRPQYERLAEYLERDATPRP